jgi:hypothetical protein
MSDNHTDNGGHRNDDTVDAAACHEHIDKHDGYN